jgi:rubrerythrin
MAAKRTGYNAYRCTKCGHWHVGRNPQEDQ